MLDTPLLRLRALQALRYGYPEKVNSDLVLRMLQEDDESIGESRVLKALIWLEDQGLCDTRVHDYQDQVILFSCVSERGLNFLNQPKARVPGILHPSEVFG